MPTKLKAKANQNVQEKEKLSNQASDLKGQNFLRIFIQTSFLEEMKHKICNKTECDAHVMMKWVRDKKMYRVEVQKIALCYHLMSCFSSLLLITWTVTFILFYRQLNVRGCELNISESKTDKNFFFFLK